MFIRGFIGILCVAFIVFGCSGSDKSMHFAVVFNHPKSISVTDTEFEELELESVISSYVGKLFINNDIIGFVDQKFSWVFQFDKNGNFISRHLGQGNGPMEIPVGEIQGNALLNGGSYLFIGSSTDCYIYDNKFQRKKTFVIDRTANKEAKGYEQPSNYMSCYENFIIKSHDDYVYYNLFLSHWEYNFIVSPVKYFEKARIIARLNLTTGEMEKVLGRYPEIYAKDKSLKQLCFTNFDLDSKGTFYVSYEADSLIYTFDQDFTPISTFGYKGREMNDKPIVLTTIDMFNEKYAQNRHERGYYNSLRYIEETGLLFRTYQKGAGSGGGLQIYRENVLIGDIDAPDGFKMLGYIAPYYYGSTSIDEDNERIILHRFKL